MHGLGQHLIQIQVHMHVHVQCAHVCHYEKINKILHDIVFFAAPDDMEMYSRMCGR